MHAVVLFLVYLFFSEMHYDKNTYYALCVQLHAHSLIYTCWPLWTAHSSLWFFFYFFFSLFFLIFFLYLPFLHKYISLSASCLPREQKTPFFGHLSQEDFFLNKSEVFFFYCIVEKKNEERI